MWQFILTDLNGTVHGELTNAGERKVVLPHLRIPSASFKIHLWHPLASTVMDTDCLLKCYRTDPRNGTRSLVFHGPVVSAEEVGAPLAQSISVTAAGPYWRLSKRLIPGSDVRATGYGLGTTASPVSLGGMAHSILAALNNSATNYTGIAAGTLTSSMTNPFTGSGTLTVGTGVYGPVFLKNAAEAIAEISAGLSSFEYIVDPEEPTYPFGGGTFPRIGSLRVAPVIGANRPDAIFEYGTTKANVAQYNRSVSRDNLLTRAKISFNGWQPNATDGKDIITRDAANLATRGLFEEVVNDAGVIDDGLRTKIADFHILYRKDPRQIITFNPVRNAKPSPITDYVQGDTVRARAVVRGNLRFDATFRIWGLTFDLDQNGNESVELELVAP